MKQSLPQLVYSSFTGSPNPAFTGYCFLDANYIYGDVGRQQFETETGRTIGPGLDGCYVSVRSVESGIEVGVDGSGLAQIFYYQKNGIWALANSLSVLVDHLRGHNVSIEVNIAQLRAFGALGTVTTQVSSFHTIFEDICLLPSYATILISASGLKLGDAPRPRILDYDTAVGTFLGIWIARIETLLRDPRVSVSADLTGGIDSRTMFAMLTTAKNGAHETGRPNFRSGRGERHAADFAAAKTIADAYEVKLNSKLPRRPPPESGPDGYARWRQVCLGVYLSVYLRRHSRDPFLHHFNGGGGENHRQFYTDGSMDDFLMAFRGRIRDPYFQKWYGEVSESMDSLVRRNPGIEPSILHYREFRNRFHTGRAPHFSVEISPLSSSLLLQLPTDANAIASRQLYFDIMESLSPGLIRFPYDDAVKDPTPQNLRDLKSIVPVYGGEPGRVYAALERDDLLEETEEEAPTSTTVFASEADRALQLNSVRDFMPARTLAKADLALKAMKGSNKLAHASEGKPLAYALTVAYALGEF